MTSKQKEKLGTLGREELKRAAKVLKLKGYTNKNKTQLVDMIAAELPKVRKAQYDAESAILTIREALKLSTSGNIKDRLKGVRKSKKESAKSGSQQAAEALREVRKAMDYKPKLTRKFKSKMDKNMEKFNRDVTNITSQQPERARRLSARASYIESANMTSYL